MRDPRPETSSLIPLDVLESYKEELEEVEVALPPAPAAPAEVGEAGAVTDIVTALSETDDEDCLSSTPARPELASEALSQIGLFKELSTAHLALLARDARTIRIHGGDELFAEGEQADSFFIVLDGALEVLHRRDGRRIPGRRLGRGEIAGLFGMLSNRRRAASARAAGELSLLEIPCWALREVMEKDKRLQGGLLRFQRDRLLQTFLGASKLFVDVDAFTQGRTIDRFAERVLAPGELLITPGEVKSLIAVVLAGRLLIERRERGSRHDRIFELLPSEYVAVTSALSGEPTHLRVFAEERCVLAVLDHHELQRLFSEHPALRGINQRLPMVANALDPNLYCGRVRPLPV